MTEEWYVAYLEARKARGLSDTDTPNRRKIGQRHFNNPEMPTPEDAAHSDDMVLFIPLSESFD